MAFAGAVTWRAGTARDVWPGAGPETGATLETGAGSSVPVPAAAAAAAGRCGPPPAASIAATPSATASGTSRPAAVAGPGRRCRRCHQRGPDGPIDRGNPAWSNAPARCAALTRRARPAGVLSVQAASTFPRSPAGGVPAASSSPSSAGSGPPAAGPSRRRHSFRATARSQAPSRPGSPSPSSLTAAMRNSPYPPAVGKG